MKLITFSLGAGARLGVLSKDNVVLDVKAAGFHAADSILALIKGGPSVLDALRDCAKAAEDLSQCWFPLSNVTLQAPIPQMPRDVFCVGRNYKLHIEEAARARGIEVSFPTVPEFFTKPAGAVVGPGAGVKRYAHLTEKLDYEVELAVVLRHSILDATPDTAREAIFGYTIVNDISARDLQFAHNQWFKGKALDSFCPMGPCIVTADEFGDASDHRISLRVNGEIRQDSTTSDLLFAIPEIIASLSAGLTLRAGDIIATGTPAGVAFGMAVPAYLQVGDVMEAEIEGIGILCNTVEA